ncbi:Ltp family lipoprotein [Microbacterium invictum]|uniref:PASTA domain-containing protein n=1 Tax=Microbacterium invictum TaxID=515415 RepID=A0AA40SRG4_9MICO|nr:MULTISPECIES: Ltp family lipoprotein [Microbacterium]MBB4141036.1 hypothetical protein [Microbacterium invictum]
MSEYNNTPALPPAGWYLDPHDTARQRYWDGARWTEQVAAPDAAATPPSTESPSAVGAAAAVVSTRRLPKLTWWQWALGALGTLVLISMIVTGINGVAGIGADSASSDPAPAEPAAAGSGGFTQDSKRPTEKPVAMIEVPDLVGVTVAEARAQLNDLGLDLEATDAGDDWIVTAQQPAQGSHPLEGLELSITSEAPKPVYTLAQQNAIGTAQDYLDYSGFSRGSLIGQLEYEGFSTEDATFGADNAGADWNAEAAESAASYLDYSSFSRQGLYDQLAYEEFTPEQIEHALSAVGY